MPVTATSPQSLSLDVGDTWNLWVDVTDDDGALASGTVSVTVTKPDASTSTPTASEDATGRYRASYVLAATGRHTAVVSVSGDVVGVVPFEVLAITAGGSALPTLSQVKVYLGETSYDDTAIQDALDAETVAQRAVCRIPAAYPADLREALLRRVARNLAMRSLPLAMPQGDMEGSPNPLLARDPEVRRFEAPYRRLVVG